MKNSKVFYKFFALFCSICVLSSCNLIGAVQQEDKKEKPVKKKEPPKPKRVSSKPAYTKGELFILEYHRFGEKEGKYKRSFKNFKKDLETLYRLGFRPVTVSQILDKNLPNNRVLPPGASPVAFTFDDSTMSQFKMDYQGNTTKDCAVGIWREFAKKHPDFPVRATFYVLPGVTFGQKAHVMKKLGLLKAWGCEIGCHTVTHRSLRHLKPASIKKEIVDSVDWIRSIGFEPTTIAVPYGNMPRPKNMKYIKGFEHSGKKYGFKANLRSMGRPARSPLSTRPEDPYRTPRILGEDSRQAVTYWLKKVEEGEVLPYIQP